MYYNLNYANWEACQAHTFLATYLIFLKYQKKIPKILMVFHELIGYVLRQIYLQADNYVLTVCEYSEPSCPGYN